MIERWRRQGFAELDRLQVRTLTVRTLIDWPGRPLSNAVVTDTAGRTGSALAWHVDVAVIGALISLDNRQGKDYL